MSLGGGTRADGRFVKTSCTTRQQDGGCRQKTSCAAVRPLCKSVKPLAASQAFLRWNIVPRTPRELTRAQSSFPRSGDAI
jgi:hypothetical protein